ncbi:MAG: IS3 family transposase, partial [Bacillota bacterium]
SFRQAYEVVAEYMEYYNCRRRHGALGYMSPQAFHEAFMCNAVSAEAFAA